MPNNSSHSLLHELAEATGLAVHWKNYLNQDQVVAPDTLRSILHALDIPAHSEAACRDSLRQLRDESAQQIPALLITRVDQPLPLPPALHPHLQGRQNLTLLDETHTPITAPLTDHHTLTPPPQPGYYQLNVGGHQLTLAVAPKCCTSIPNLTGKQRAWGVGVQLYSLRHPGDGGVGDFTALKEFAVAMAQAGADGIAVSPAHALFSADRSRFSPYAPSSRLFTNVLHIDPAHSFSSDLIQSCLRQATLEGTQHRLEQESLIDWPEAARVKLTLLRCLWEQNQAALMDTGTDVGRTFQAFRDEAGEALESHATFEALHAWHLAKNPSAWHWHHWAPEYQDHTSAAVKQFAAQHRQDVLFHGFLQWLADRGLADAQAACRAAGAGIGLIADLAVGTDSGGSHAWSRKEDMLTGLSVGAPPDLLNHQGQDWGLTSFSPRALAAHGYGPYLEMLRDSLRHAGGLRIDHILGLRRLWLIPEGAPPQQGAYLHFPQDDLLSLIALESWRHRAIIVGEDLGTVPRNFREHLANMGLLGMGVLWFEKDAGLFIEPSRWRRTAVATTTTHDLPTVAGWWRGRDLHWNEKLNRLPEDRSREDLEREREQDRTALWAAFQYAGLVEGDKPSPDQTAVVVDQALAFIAQTPSPLALVPVEDLLGLEEQPNLPGTIQEHPNWRRRLPLPGGDIAGDRDVRRRLAILARNREAAGKQQD